MREGCDEFCLAPLGLCEFRCPLTQLTFELLDVMCGLSSVVLYYVNQVGSKTGEYMELDGNQKVVRVVANYSLTRRPL